MNGKLKGTLMLVCWLLAIGLLAGCVDQKLAQFGSLVGKGLGRPVGAVAVALEETFATAGEVERLNPRRQQALPVAPMPSPAVAGDDFPNPEAGEAAVPGWGEGESAADRDRQQSFWGQ